MPDTARPTRLTDTQLQPAIQVMSKAFIHDPFLKHLAPDEATRARLTPEFVAIPVKYCFHYGEVWTTPNLDGVACWLVPGKTTPSFGGIVRTGMLTMPLKFGWQGFQRFTDVISYTDALHKPLASTPHWYLWGLGIDPTQQGKGHGSRLLEPVLSKADAAGQSCYLETQNETNLPFYRKHGFEVSGHGTSPKSHLPVWAMIRPPRIQ